MKSCHTSINERKICLKKIKILTFLAAATLLSGCSAEAEPSLDGYLGQDAIVYEQADNFATDDANENLTPENKGTATSTLPELSSPEETFQIRDKEEVEREETILLMTEEYLMRVYNVDENYAPEYVDESTTPEQIIEAAFVNSVSSRVKEVTVTEMTHINDEMTSVTAVMKADYEDRTIPADEYYIAFYLDFQKKDSEWKIMSSEWINCYSTEICTLEKNNLTGEYEYVPIE